jgi:prefoldin subunit 1
VRVFDCIWFTEADNPCHCRFIHSPINTVNTRLASETQTLKSDIAGLEKKLNYLETTHQKSKENLEQIFKGASA